MRRLFSLCPSLQRTIFLMFTEIVFISIIADNVPSPADDQDLPTSTGTLTSGTATYSRTKRMITSILIIVPGNNFVTTIINLMRSVTITTSYNATTTSSQTLSTTVTTTRNSLTTTTTTNPTTSTVALVTSSTTATVISSTTIFTMNSSTSSSQTSATITTTITITTTSSSSTATVTTMSRSLTTTTQAVTPTATTSENRLTTATSIIMTTISNSLATATQSFTTSTTATVISLTITSVTMDPTAYTSQTSPTVTSTIATATPMTNENLSTIITNTISQTSSAMIITTANTTETSSPTMTSITTATTTRPLITNYYVQFSFPLNVPNDTSNDTQLVDQLMSVFNRALNVPSNQINITITNRVLRNSRPVTVQVRFFSTAAESADNLLTRTRAQLDNSSSEFQRDSLTAQLNSSSIENIKQYYICSNGAVQESPCTADEIFKTGSALTTVLLASIIPSIFGVIILAIMGFMITRYIRRPSLKPRTSRFDRF